MKKIIIILALMATGMCAKAQVDTLFLGDRNPVYYYWDTNWWDHYALHHITGNQVDWVYTSYDLSWCKPEYARYCYTESPLRVIGIATSLFYHVSRYSQYDYTPDSVFINNMVSENFRLYEVDSITDDMILLAEGEWSVKMQPSHYMVVSKDCHPGFNNMYSFKPVFEVYFDSAITVYDSFYVAVTGNNRYNRGGSVSYAVPKITGSKAYVGSDSEYDISDCRPKPNHYRRKLHLLNSINYDNRYWINDTNWHTFNNWYHVQNPALDTNTPAAWDLFAYIFPIIDTSTVLLPPECSVPTGINLMYAGPGVATLVWNGGNADHWELSVCRDGCEPENGNITTWNSTVATVQGLDTEQWYAARVRSVCNFGDSTYYSDWSDSVMFYVPGDTTGNGGGDNPNRIETTADRYTYLMPNPASETVTVASSFRIGDVEVYTLEGRRILASRVDGISTTLDISQLPTGTYIVRITTNNGTAYKKLVVK